MDTYRNNFRYICVYGLENIYFLFCALRGLSQNDTLVAKNTPGAQILVSNVVLQ